MKLPGKLAWLALSVALAGCAQTRLSRDSAHLVSDQPGRPSSGVRVTYLGTAGFLLESRDATVLIDPYFTRPSLARTLADAPIAPDLAAHQWALRHLPSRAAHPDCILVTHGHVDHALDAVQLAKTSQAKLVASPSTCFIAEAAGVDPARLRPLAYGATAQCGPVRITALESPHTKLLCRVPFPGIETSKPKHAPRKMSDWKVGEPLAFLIEMGGRRIYHGSGAAALGLPTTTAPVDLAILGVSSRDDQGWLAGGLHKLRPRYFLPTHQDNFFRPLDEGFSYMPIADFGAARQTWERWNQRDPRRRLILLDYFQPWTLR